MAGRLGSALGVLRAQRTGLGWLVLAVGAGLCVLGWYGVSGERYTARQIPYLASATAPGAALIIGGFVLLAIRGKSEETSSEQEQTLRQLELLYRLLTEEAAMLPETRTTANVVGSGNPSAAALTAANPATPAASAAHATPGTHAAPGAPGIPLLAVPGGGTYHRADCLLVQGRQDPEPLSRSALAGRNLRPCPLCDPPAREG